MSQIILDNTNLSLFNKRLQKALEEYTGQSVKLNDAAKIMAKTMGEDTPQELKKVLENSQNLINLYFLLDKSWENSYQIPSNKRELSTELSIYNIYSEEVYETIKNDENFLLHLKEKEKIIIAVQVDQENWNTSLRTSNSIKNWCFDIYLLEENGRLKTKHD